jgi:hypothetical protein
MAGNCIFPQHFAPSLTIFAEKCNACIYLCLCGSLLESVQEGKGEIIYQFRQHGVMLARVKEI